MFGLDNILHIREDKVTPYDKESEEPVLRRGICTGELVAGFCSLRNGRSRCSEEMILKLSVEYSGKKVSPSGVASISVMYILSALSINCLYTDPPPMMNTSSYLPAIFNASSAFATWISLSGMFSQDVALEVMTMLSLPGRGRPMLL